MASVTGALNKDLVMQSFHPPKSRLSKAFLTSTLLTGVAGTVAAAGFAFLPGQGAAFAQQAEGRRDLNIPAQPLASALSEFARRTGWNLSYDPALVRGRMSAAVSGPLAPETALNSLVAGSGLDVVISAPGSAALVAPAVLPEAASGDAIVLDLITIVGAGNEVTEGSGSYTTGAMSAATRLPLAVHETPQAVTVITRQKMDDQGMVTVEDTIRNSTGFSLRKWGGERARFYARGFSVNTIMLDGMSVAFEPDTFTDSTLAMYDHVESVRGATGLVSGTGDPSGTLNFVRKRPTDVFQGSMTARAGSWSDLGAELDVSGPLNETGSLRGRFVTTAQDRDSFVQDYENKRQLYYGILEYDLTDSTTLTFGGYYNRERNPGADWNGIATNPDGSFLDIPRSTRMSPSWSYWDKEGQSLFAEVEHRFDNGWTAKLAARGLDTEMDMRGTFLLEPVLDANGQPNYDLRAGAYQYDRKQRNYDASLSGPVDLFGRSHQLVFGVSHKTTTWKDGGASYTQPDGSWGLLTINPYTWDPRSFPVPATLGYWGSWSSTRSVDETNLYATGLFELSDQLNLITGGQLVWYNLDTMVYIPAEDTMVPQTFKETGKFTPYAGLTYKLNDNWAVFGSYTTIFRPQTAYTTADGGALSPVQGKNIEFGTKATFNDERVNLGISFFHTVQENLPRSLPTSECTVGTECYTGVGEVTSKGVDLEIAGEVMPRLNVMAGYTYTDAKVTESSNGIVAGDRYNTNLPQHQLKLSTMYHLPGDQLRIGGALRWQSKMTSASLKDINSAHGITPIVQGSYAVVDLSAGYRVNDRLDVQVNINNVFDKYYYETIGGFEGSNSFGAPRNVLLTAKMTF